MGAKEAPGNLEGLGRNRDPRRAHRPAQPAALVIAAVPASLLYYFNVRSTVGLTEDPEGLTCPNMKAALEVASALARRCLAEGRRKGEDRVEWQVEVMDRVNHHVLSLPFADASVRDKPPNMPRKWKHRRRSLMLEKPAHGIE